MSKFTIARTCSSGKGGWLTKYSEPSNPISSAAKATKTRLRAGRRSGWLAKYWANPSSTAVPEALSSAPLCGASTSGASEPGPPRPRWS